MQLRAQNLLHRISLQADTARCVRTVTTGFNSSSDNRILEGDSQRTPALGSPWPSCWCRGPASESSTPRRVSHSGGGRNSNKTSSHVSQHSCCHAWKKKSSAGRVKGCGINLESLSFSYSLFATTIQHTHPSMSRDIVARCLNRIVMSPLKYTPQNELGIMRHLCKHACAQICDNSQMKYVAMFFGVTKIFTKHKIKLQICLRINWNTKLSVNLCEKCILS